MTTPRKLCDLFLDQHQPTERCPDPDHVAALARRANSGVEWSPIVVGRDGGGRRDFLDGQPIHCGTGLELQAFEVRSDDYGEWRVWLQTSMRVRYEMEWGGNRRGVLYACVAGHEFTAPINEGMRFRRPERRR
jgi:hypothetical protein